MTALEGIRVLDFTRVLAGPYCTLVLGDLGAEIIKIENPQGGDDTRGFNISPTLDFSTYFLAVNRNKKSVAIDIRTTEGRDAIHAMAANADVVIENYRSGVMERYGIGYDDLAKVNSQLIFASVSAYGRDGPLKDRPGYDPIVQAESGFMSLTGEPNGQPMRTGVSIADMFTGMFAGQAILAALIARDKIGHGQRIDDGIERISTDVTELEGSIAKGPAGPVGVLRDGTGFLIADARCQSGHQHQ